MSCYHRILLVVVACTYVGELQAQATLGKHKESSQCQVGTARSDLFRILERTNTGKEYLLEGHNTSTDATAVPRKRIVQESRTVDPRSTLIIEFATSMKPCVPIFNMLLRARVTSGSSDRALEIPYYYVTGSAAPVQKVAFSSSPQRAVRLFTAFHRELGELLADVKLNAPSEIDPNASQSMKARLLENRQAIEALKKQTSAKQAELTNKRERLETNLARPAVTDSQSLMESSNQLRNDIQQLELDLASFQGRIVETSLEAQKLDSQNRDGAKQLAAKLSDLPVLNAVVREFSDARNGMIKRLANNLVSQGNVVDETLVYALISSVERSLNAIRELDKKFTDSIEVSDQDLTRLSRLTTSLVRDANALRQIQPANNSGPNEGLQELDIPTAYIDLPKNAVKEGDRIVIEITVKDDTAVTEFWSSELQTRKQGFVKNIRDVALFIDRQRRNQNDFGVAARNLAEHYKRQLQLPVFNRLDYDLLPTSSVIAGSERYFPAPGVVLEGHIRPRLLQATNEICPKERIPKLSCKGSNWGSRITQSAFRFVRNLDVSVGLSVSVVGFSEQLVAINPPNAADFSKLFEEADIQKRLSAFQEATTLSTRVQSTSSIDVAPAAHIGLFDGAVSVAYGLALRAPDKKSFVAVGFSFLGLTERGGKLIGDIFKQ